MVLLDQPGRRRRRVRGHVLIVDDNKDHRVIYTRYLTAHGFRVSTAVNGEVAGAVVRDLMPSVVVMDLAMPHLDGWEATRRLKADPETRHIPIIACSGHVTGGSAERALEAGCEYYVAKPCKPEDLLAVIRRALRPRRTRRT